MKKTTILFLLLFVILGGLAYWLSSQSETTTNTPGLTKQFAINDTKQVGKIFLANKLGQTILLERKKDHWTVNNEKNVVRKQAIELLLASMKALEVKYTPAKAAEPNIIKDLASNGLKVEVYNLQNEKIKVYYIGGTDQSQDGTHMILEGEEQPYVVHIPNFVGNLSTRYLMREKDWLDRTLFSESEKEIASLSLIYPKKTSMSFNLNRTDNNWDIKPINEVGIPNGKAFLEHAAISYLQNFDKVIAEARLIDNHKADSISLTTPFCEIQMETIDGEKKTLKFFPLVTTDSGRQLSGKKNEVASALIQKYHVSVEQSGEKNMYLAQQIVLGKLFVSIEHFYRDS